MRIRLYATLRPLAGVREAELPAADGETVGAALQRLIANYPGLDGHLLTADAERLLPHVQVFIGGRSVRDLHGLATPLPPDADLAIFPPVAGG